MTSQYNLDLETISLDRFRSDLESTEMLPGRTILQEDIAGRFAVLEAMRVCNLKELVSALSTKQKIRGFSEASGLPVEYLVILGRQARSYVPKLVSLRDIPGVDPEQVRRLAEVGILHSKHLFDRGATPADRAALAKETGIPEADLLELVSLSDLARVGGMGPVFVRLFYAAGVDSLATLAGWAPEALFEWLHAVNRERRLSHVVPSLKDVTNYVEKARELPKVIVVG
jgi:DNA polymerase/3'-5' exonuclease PolX